MFEEQDPNHHSDSQAMGKEAGLNYTVNSAAPSLRSGNMRTVNYLVHRMLWEQQEKIDLDDLEMRTEGIMSVEDRPH
ncbi:MAG: hypothetical protein RIN56_17460 [Sporomusaceae bacterium]|nr:hypothetical protein [Sporomusaceae bacterium]